MTLSAHTDEAPQVMRPVYTVPRGVASHDVMRFMAARGTRAVVVLAGLRPVGIVTSRDLAERVPGAGLSETPVKVESAMSSPLVRINERGAVVDAIATMLQRGVSHLPIVSTSGFLVSLITLDEAKLLRDQNVPVLNEFVRTSVIVPMVRRSAWTRTVYAIRKRIRENRMWWLMAAGLAVAGALLALAIGRSWLGFQTYEMKDYEPKDLSREQYLEQKHQSQPDDATRGAR